VPEPLSSLDSSQRRIAFAPPDIGEEEIAEVVATLRSGWITAGPRVKQFEVEFRRLVSSPAAAAMSSCTAALHVALKVLGIGPGDEVVTTTMTFCSTVHVIEQVGAVPVLVDVDPMTLNLSLDEVEQAVVDHPRVRAIIPVHYAGHPCDMDRLHRIAAHRDIAILEDAAHAVGASYKGSPVGSVAAHNDRHAVAFSFYATKNLATGEGGMLTGSERTVDAARTWALHGMSNDAWKRYESLGAWYYEVVVPGFKYNMTDIQAALGLVQLRRFEQMQSRRREVAAAYTRHLGGIPELQLPASDSTVRHAWHLYPIRLDSDHTRIDRAEFIEALGRLGVGCSVHFIPVHMHPYYRDKYNLEPSSFPVATKAYRGLVSLPMHPGLSASDVDYVVASVKRVLASS
jgi:dTDP-4-amino-4,6-dideoxygalactose transaminase